MSEAKQMFKEAKHLILTVLPNTISGFVIIFIGWAALGDPIDFEFTVFVLKTGAALVGLTCSYYAGSASLILVNSLLSSFTHEKRSTQ